MEILQFRMQVAPISLACNNLWTADCDSSSSETVKRKYRPNTFASTREDRDTIRSQTPRRIVFRLVPTRQ